MQNYKIIFFLIIVISSFNNCKQPSHDKLQLPKIKESFKIRNSFSEKHLIKFKKTAEMQANKYSNYFFLEANHFRKEVSLTFDDGPDPIYTIKILKILKKFNIKATFFMRGFRIKKFPEIVKKVYDQGHEIANHTYNHNDLRSISLKNTFNIEVIKNENLLNKITKQKHNLIRPAYGAISNNQIQYLGKKEYKIILWSIDSMDWHPTLNNETDIINIIKKHIHPGAIILMHDACNYNCNTSEVLPEIIQYARMKGYSFKTVSELLK